MTSLVNEYLLTRKCSLRDLSLKNHAWIERKFDIITQLIFVKCRNPQQLIEWVKTQNSNEDWTWWFDKDFNLRLEVIDPDQEHMTMFRMVWE